MVIRDILGICDEKMDLKKRRFEDGAEEYRKTNNMVQKALKKAKKDWIDTQLKETDSCLNKKKQTKKKQDSIPAGNRYNSSEAGTIHNYQGKVWEMSYRGITDSKR